MGWSKTYQPRTITHRKLCLAVGPEPKLPSSQPLVWRTGLTVELASMTSQPGKEPEAQYINSRFQILGLLHFTPGCDSGCEPSTGPCVSGSCAIYLLARVFESCLKQQALRTGSPNYRRYPSLNPDKLGAFTVCSGFCCICCFAHVSDVSSGLPAGSLPGGGQPPLPGDPGLSSSHILRSTILVP